MSLYENILAGLDRKNESLVTLEKCFTAGELQDAVFKYEMMLSPFNLEGKRVALLVPTISEFLPLFFAVNKLKGTVSPLSLQLRKGDLLNVLDFLDPHVVFSVNDHSGFGFSEVVTNWASGMNREALIFTSDDCTNWEVEIFHGSCKPLQSQLGGFITFTSGSTGTPKGVVFKDEVLQYGYDRLLDAMKLEPSDTVFVYTAPSTLYGVSSMNAMLKVGATLVTADDFDLVKMIHTMKKVKCNKITTTPSIFKSLYNFASRLDEEVVRNLELVCVIGEKVPANFKNHFPLMEDCTFLSHYGSSESGSLANAYMSEDTDELLFTMPKEVDCKTVDGELFVKSGGLFTEYYQNPILTAEVLEDGWFKMGDLVEFIDQQTFKIVGRKKDVIKKGGVQVIASEVEQILSQIDGIKGVAVVGSPHEVFGEQIVAFIISDGITSKDIRSYCAGNFSSYKIPDKMIFIDEFPLINGKVDKMKLKSQLSRG